MKKALLLLSIFVSSITFAQKDFTPTNWVSDFANMYTPEQEKLLNSKISEYEKKTSIEIGVVTVDSLTNQSIEEYANEQFNRIGVGKKGADNGLLIVFSLKDKASRIEVGRGMEPFYTDYDSDLDLDVLKPYFRKSNYFDGTMETINAVINRLGDKPYSERVEWLRKQREREEVESEIARQKFYSGLRWTASILSFLGLLGWIYWLDRRNKKIKKDISDSQDFIKNYNFVSETYNSNIVKSSLDIVNKYKLDLISKLAIDKNEKNEDYLKRLNTYKFNIIKRSDDHSKLVRSVLDKKREISNIPTMITLLESLNSKAIKSNSEILKYGYRSTYNEIDLSGLKSIASSFKDMTDVDKSISEYSKFSNLYDSLQRGPKLVINKLNEIVTAEKDVKLADSKISSYLSDINKYKKYLKSGELDVINKKVKEFNGSSSDLLTKAGILASVLTLLIGLISKLKSRKSDEEEETRRIERRRQDNSYYGGGFSSGSSGSSNSDSGFSGFGGGSSGGGGASDGW